MAAWASVKMVILSSFPRLDAAVRGRLSFCLLFCLIILVSSLAASYLCLPSRPGLGGSPSPNKARQHQGNTKQEKFAAMHHRGKETHRGKEQEIRVEIRWCPRTAGSKATRKPTTADEPDARGVKWH